MKFTPPVSPRPRITPLTWKPWRGESGKRPDEFAGHFDRSPENSQLVSYDRETGKYQYSKEVSGLKLDRDQLAADVLTAVNSGSYTASIPPSLTIIPPERTQTRPRNNTR